MRHDDRGIPAGKVLLGGLVGLILAAVLNAGALLRDAEQKPFGTARDVSVAIWSPVEAASSALGLTAPRRWADEALGRDVSDDLFVLADGPTTTTIPFATRATTPRTPGEEPAPTSSTAGVPTTVPTSRPTAQDPLDLWIVGDSMVQFFGAEMEAIAEDTGVIEATRDHVLSSGLTRPDFYDWPARFDEILTDEDPDALIVMFGGNDAQGIQTPNGRASTFEQAWIDEYSTRVGAVMDLLGRGRSRTVLWVGQPIMDRDDFDEKMQQLNAIYEAQASSRDHVTFVPTRELFQDPDGGYSRFLPDEDGELVDLRLTDGIHLSTAGGLRLSEELLRVLGTVVDLQG